MPDTLVGVPEVNTAIASESGRARNVPALYAGQNRHPRGRPGGGRRARRRAHLRRRWQRRAEATSAKRPRTQAPADPRRPKRLRGLATQRRASDQRRGRRPRGRSTTSSLSPEQFGREPELDEGNIRFQLHRVPNCVGAKRLRQALKNPLGSGRLLGASYRLPAVLGTQRSPRRTARRRRQLLARDAAGDLLPRPAAGLLPHRHQPGQ